MKKPSKPTKRSEQAVYAAVYLDPQRFPLTTQEDLTLQEQKMLDAANIDDMHRLVAEGRILTPEQQAIAKEFEEKAKLGPGPTQLNTYLDPKRFPLTTQGDLGLHDQMLIDAVKRDSLREFRENGGTFSRDQEAIAKELEEKAKWHHDPADLAAALAESEIEDDLDDDEPDEPASAP